MNWIRNTYLKAVKISKNKRQQWFFVLLLAFGIFLIGYVYHFSAFFYLFMLTPILIQIASSIIIEKLIVLWMFLGLLWSSIIGNVFLFLIYILILFPNKIFVKQKHTGWHSAENNSELEQMY